MDKLEKIKKVVQKVKHREFINKYTNIHEQNYELASKNRENEKDMMVILNIIEENDIYQLLLTRAEQMQHEQEVKIEYYSTEKYMTESNQVIDEQKNVLRGIKRIVDLIKRHLK